MQVVPDLPAAIDPDLGARNYFWVFIHSAAGKGGAIHGDVSLRWCKNQKNSQEMQTKTIHLGPYMTQ